MRSPGASIRQVCVELRPATVQHLVLGIDRSDDPGVFGVDLDRNQLASPSRDDRHLNADRAPHLDDITDALLGEQVRIRRAAGQSQRNRKTVQRPMVAGVTGVDRGLDVDPGGGLATASSPRAACRSASELVMARPAAALASGRAMYCPAENGYLSNVRRLTAALDQPVDAVANGNEREACASDWPRGSADVFILTGRVRAISPVFAGLRGRGNRRQSESQDRSGKA
jgi:hypothetical protein